MAFNYSYLSWNTLNQVIWTEVVTVRIFGSEYARERYKYFSSPHAKFPLIPRKSLGAAMINLQGGYIDYHRDKLRTLAKKNARSAQNKGYSYAKIDALSAIDQIMEINRSRPMRGGRPMSLFYFDRSKFEVILRRTGSAHIVKCSAGKVVAYALVSNIGDLWTIDYVLGHGNHLKSGIMYLLLDHVIREKFEFGKVAGAPRWIMYDTWLGANPGLRQFKAALGFSPLWVRWKWTEATLREELS